MFIMRLHTSLALFTRDESRTSVPHGSGPVFARRRGDFDHGDCSLSWLSGA